MGKFKEYAFNSRTPRALRQRLAALSRPRAALMSREVRCAAALLVLYRSIPALLRRRSLFVGGARRGSGGEEGDDGGVAIPLRLLEWGSVSETTD